jgi:hypothetical protein
VFRHVIELGAKDLQVLVGRIAEQQPTWLQRPDRAAEASLLPMTVPKVSAN